MSMSDHLIEQLQGKSLEVALDTLRRAEEVEQIMLKAQREAANKNWVEERALFHKLWDAARDTPGYVDEDWRRLQVLLNQRGLPV